MSTIEEARQLISQRRIYEAFAILQKLRTSPNPPEKAWLEWAGLATLTPFSYFSIESARKEYELFRSADSQQFIQAIEHKLKTGRERSSKDYPLISLIAVAFPDTEKMWLRCIESLNFQFNTKVELYLVSPLEASQWGTLPSFVKLVKPLSATISLRDEYSRAIRDVSGEIVSVIDNPSTIYSDHGLVIIGAAFKTVTEMVVAQTERLCYGFEGVATPVRIEVPRWSQAILLDPLCLEAPTLYFTWRGTFFRRKNLIEECLPFREGVNYATAFDAAVKLSRQHPIHSVRVPVVVDDTGLDARSFPIPVAEASEAAEVIRKELANLSSPPSYESPEIVEISPKTYNFHSFPKVAPFILNHGRRSAPPISLVTPVYNCRDYLERCINSVLDQNYPNLEYIVLDGGSTDGTQEIIKKYEKYLTFWKSGPDGGHYAAVQEGLNRTKGSIMSWINADDFLTPYTFDLVASIFTERKEIEWITGKFCMTSDKNDLDISLSIPLFSADNYFDDAFDRPFIQQEGTFWRRSLWNKAGASLDLRLKLAADMELWTRFFQYARLYTVSVPLGAFMRRKGQRSEAFQSKYYHESYMVIQRLKALGIKPYTPAVNDSTMLDIPLDTQATSSSLAL